jgi:3-oxoacyl-[acyl-carrier protein] reductase
MSKRSILISGANGALGMSMGRGFINESGDNFVWLGIHNRRAHADALAKEFPQQCACVSLDVTSPGAWASAVKTVLARDQRIDALINNAGIHEDGLLAMLPASAWQRVIATNLDGAFHGCQAVLPSMIAQRSGRIINMASLSALLAPAGQTNYAAAKAGVVALSQSLAKEVARLGVTVNVICPGYIETEALNSLKPEEKQAALSRIPMRRFGQPEEIAAAVRFLACPAASYITGCVLKIDGGIL